MGIPWKERWGVASFSASVEGYGQKTEHLISSPTLKCSTKSTFWLTALVWKSARKRTAFCWLCWLYLKGKQTPVIAAFLTTLNSYQFYLSFDRGYWILRKSYEVKISFVISVATYSFTCFLNLCVCKSYWLKSGFPFWDSEPTFSTLFSGMPKQIHARTVWVLVRVGSATPCGLKDESKNFSP